MRCERAQGSAARGGDGDTDLLVLADDGAVLLDLRLGLVQLPPAHLLELGGQAGR